MFRIKMELLALILILDYQSSSVGTVFTDSRFGPQHQCFETTAGLTLPTLALIPLCSNVLCSLRALGNDKRDVSWSATVPICAKVQEDRSLFIHSECETPTFIYGPPCTPATYEAIVLKVGALNPEQIRCACSYKPKNRDTYVKPDWLHEHNGGKQYESSYNIAPSEVTPVLVATAQFRQDSSADRALKPMMWGIIPPWHKGDYKSHKLSTNNCRLEGIRSSKLYYPILQSGGRCIIVAEGFYEWQTAGGAPKTKRPHYLYAPQKHHVKVDERDSWKDDFDETKGWMGINLLHMAGLYSVWKNDDTIIYSYSVITMESNSTLDWLHHRMPAILDTEEQISAWLDVGSVDADLALSYLTPVKLLSWHQVSQEVNSTRNKSANCNKNTTISTNKSKAQGTLSAWLVKPPCNKRANDDYDSNSVPKRMSL